MILETTFGTIDLSLYKVEFWISNTSSGNKRRVSFEGISSQSQSNETAFLQWKVWQYDLQERILPEREFVQGRDVYTCISGSNKVNYTGITIKREGFPEGEVGDRAFQMAWNAGHNEYRFWMAVLHSRPLPEAIQAAGMILAQFGVFD